MKRAAPIWISEFNVVLFAGARAKFNPPVKVMGRVFRTSSREEKCDTHPVSNKNESGTMGKQE